MPRWLLGGILGLFTGGLDLTAAIRQNMSSRQILFLILIRTLIGFAIGSPVLYHIVRHIRWIRGAVISIMLSIPIAMAVPANWQSIIGFGIAYGIIIGYAVDRILPTHTIQNKNQ